MYMHSRLEHSRLELAHAGSMHPRLELAEARHEFPLPLLDGRKPLHTVPYLVIKKS